MLSILSILATSPSLPVKWKPHSKSVHGKTERHRRKQHSKNKVGKISVELFIKSVQLRLNVSTEQKNTRSFKVSKFDLDFQIRMRFLLF